jgi:uncharacterized protein YcbK (DUF882 family)
MSARSRRGFLVLSAAAVLTNAVVVGTRAEEKQPRRLRLVHAWTGERLDIVYFKDGDYLPDALAKLDRFMRDPVNGEVGQIDRKLYDYLSDLQAALGGEEPLRLHSAYRSAKTNAAWAAQSARVARDSLHMKGQAADVSRGDVDARRLAAAAISLKRGGVGLYGSQIDFIHVDLGPVRSWVSERPQASAPPGWVPDKGSP